jgi:RNA-binding protein
MAAKKKKAQQLSPGQKRELRGLGHHLKPTAMLGKEGFTENVIASIEAILTARELLKVKIQENFPGDRHEAAEELSRATGATVVQVLGRTILLYRANLDLADDKRITLSRS